MTQSKILHYISIPFLCIIPCLTYFLVEWLQGEVPNPIQLNFWLNILVYFGVTALVYALTWRVFLSAVIPMLLFFILGSVNHFMIALRGKALLPWDFFALSTAQNVASGFSLHWDIALIMTSITVIAVCIAAWFLRKARPPRPVRAIAAVLAVLCLGSVWWILWDTPDSISSDPWYTVSASKQNGLAVNLIHNTKSLINLPPDGYSTQHVREIVGMEQSAGWRNPDIIVIMDESFSDLSQIADLQTEKDPISFIHSLKTNTIQGMAHVSVFGGGTCNTEYDFLTGSSSVMLRPGSYPMVQFLSGDMPSIAQTLRQSGYRTVGIHPFYPDGWNRDQAYPKLGFDRFYSIDDFQEPALLREYISDRESFRKVYEFLEQSDQPAFIFNVTMQNHFGYDKAFENLTEEAVFPEMEEFPQTRRYLSLISHTDRAVQELITALQKRTRPTIVLFFGDHLPAIEEEYYQILQERAGLSDEQMNEKKHMVPFFIWANFSIKAQQNLDLSASFLSPLLLDVAGAPMSSYQCYLRRLMQKMPILQNDKHALEHEYKIVQHNMVFDLLGRQNDLFYIR